MKLGIIAISHGGKELAVKIAKRLPVTILDGETVAGKLADNWSEFNGFICIMATGIVVRAITPLLTDKYTDPCVVVLDENGRHVISLLAGHLGGGNELARQVATLTGGEAIITTASDTLGLVALDLWARNQKLAANKEDLTQASSILVNRGSLTLFSEIEVSSLPSGLNLVAQPEEVDIIISNKNWPGKLVVRPKNLDKFSGCLCL